MTETLTTLIARIQVQLLDDGTLFSTATVSAAVRQALAAFNRSAPINGAELIAVDSTMLQYELTGGSFPDLVLDVHDVLLNDDDGDEDEPLEYDPIFEDNRIWIRLRDYEQSGNLLIRFAQPHTINGLDSETESTMTTDQEQVLVDGACGYSIAMRLQKPIEQINLNDPSSIVASYEKAAIRYMTLFAVGLGRYTRRVAPVSERNDVQWTLDD